MSTMVSIFLLCTTSEDKKSSQWKWMTNDNGANEWWWNENEVGGMNTSIVVIHLSP
jgi:hypothetical protein